MKLLLLANPYANGGDYLILDRVVELLKLFKPYAEIHCQFEPNKLLDPSIINQYAAVITGGGGAQFSEQFIRQSPTYRLIDQIKIPIHYMGTGIYSSAGFDAVVYQIQYSADIIAYFNKVIDKGGQLAARDTIVEAILKNNGLQNVIMTGCPAWYDYRRINSLDLESTNLKSPAHVKELFVSNHGLTKNQNDHAAKIGQMVSLLTWLKRKYHKAQITLTFNDGIETRYSRNYNATVQEYALAHGVKCLDLSYDGRKFEAIRHADLHVGFRVHTHLYLLSQRVPSLLIEEDIRGFGMNEVLGLPHVTAYDEEMMMETGRFSPNSYLLKKTDNVLDHMMSTNFIDTRTAFVRMKNAFDVGMVKWLRNIPQAGDQGVDHQADVDAEGGTDGL